MSSLKTKIRLSTALAFSATLGMAATTALVPATVVAAESEISAFDFSYPVVTVPHDQYVTIHPTFRGGDEGSTVWSLDNQTGNPLPQDLNASLDPSTGAISFIPTGDLVNNGHGVGNHQGSETFHVRATRDGKSFDVPVTFKIEESSMKGGRLAYNINGRALYDSTVPTIDTAKVQKENGDISDANGEFRFDKESPFWQDRFDEYFELDATNGSIKALKPIDFSDNFVSLGAQPYRIILPIIATVDGIEGERRVPVQMGINPLLRTVAPMRIDSVTLKQGETATRDLYFLASSEFDGDRNGDGSLEARKRYAWSDGSYDNMPTIQVPEGADDETKKVIEERFTPQVDYPADFPEWIKWDPVTRVASVEPPEDLEPGTYTYDFYFSYGQDADAIESYRDRMKDEDSRQDMKAGGVSDVEVPDKLKVPFVITVLEKDAVLPETDGAVDSSTGGTQEGTGITDNTQESAGAVSGSSVLTPASTQGTPEETAVSAPSRGVLASTGANVTALIALGILAMIAGAAFLVSRRRTS